MKSSVDYSQTFSAAGYEQAQYDAEYVNLKKYKEDVIIDSRHRDEWGFGTYKRLVDSDPVIYLEDKDNRFLFRRFAQLTPNVKQASDIIDFVNHYGPLGISAIQTFGGLPSLVSDTGIVNPFPGRSNLVEAERIRDWCDEIYEMSEVLERFELVLRVRQDDLEGYKKIKARERLKILFYGGSEIHAGSHTLIDGGDIERIKKSFSHPDIAKYCDEGDIESAELAYVGLRISRQLHKHTSLTLAWNLDDRSSKLQFRTITLIGALWLQFAEYVTQARRLNFCRICGDPIPIVGRSARSDKNLCGKKCSKQASRTGRTVRKRKKPQS